MIIALEMPSVLSNSREPFLKETSSSCENDNGTFNRSQCKKFLIYFNETIKLHENEQTHQMIQKLSNLIIHIPKDQMFIQKNKTTLCALGFILK